MKPVNIFVCIYGLVSDMYLPGDRGPSVSMYDNCLYSTEMTSEYINIYPLNEAKKVLPGIEPGLLESESKVITRTAYRPLKLYSCRCRRAADYPVVLDSPYADPICNRAARSCTGLASRYVRICTTWNSLPLPASCFSISRILNSFTFTAN